jgi:hypothetical protein
MPVDYIRYDLLTQEALRGVVRTVLTDAAKNGLPGEHHFYVTFETRAEGVNISSRLLAQHDTEMTIVLQHQFWDLKVHEDGFEVGLSFNGVPEKLVVPYAAIKGFFDPSVQFGLQFETIPEGATQQPTGPKIVDPARTAAPTTDAPPAVTDEAAKPAAVADKDTAGEDGPDKPDGGAEVVRLDRFRKK